MRFRLVAAAALVAAAGAGLLLPRASYADDSALAVTVNGMPVSVESNLASAKQQDGQSYTECFSDGTTRQVTLSGWSVATVLTAAGVPQGKATSVSVERNDGSSYTLQPADFDPSAAGYPTFSEGPALLIPRGEGLGLQTNYDFFRPFRGKQCSDDPNGPDYVVTPTGGTLSLAITSGTALSVTASADSDTASVGQAVQFTGSVSNPPDGESLTYRWTFSDHTVAMGQTVSHAFTAAGKQSATLSVASGADAGGTSDPVAVTVTGPTASATPTASASASGSASASASATPSRSATASATPSKASPTPVRTTAAPSATPSAPATTPAPATGGVRSSGRATATARASSSASGESTFLPTLLPAATLPATAAPEVSAPAPLIAPTIEAGPDTSVAAGQTVTGQVVGLRSRRGGRAAQDDGLPSPAAQASDAGSTGGSVSVPAGVGVGVALLACLGGGAVGELVRDRKRLK